MDKVKIELEIDLQAIKDTIEQAKDLNDNQEVFNKLVSVYKVQNEINRALDDITSVLIQAKGLIKHKADTIFGKDWTAIKGHGYKITRQNTGAVFITIPDKKPAKEFVQIKEVLNSKRIEEYIKETGKLPKGIEYNSNRGDSIQIKLDLNNEDS